MIFCPALPSPQPPGEFSLSPTLYPLNPKVLCLSISPLLPLLHNPLPHEDDVYLYPQFPGVARPLQTGEKTSATFLACGWKSNACRGGLRSRLSGWSEVMVC